MFRFQYRIAVILASLCAVGTTAAAPRSPDDLVERLAHGDSAAYVASQSESMQLDDASFRSVVEQLESLGTARAEVVASVLAIRRFQTDVAAEFDDRLRHAMEHPRPSRSGELLYFPELRPGRDSERLLCAEAALLIEMPPSMRSALIRLLCDPKFRREAPVSPFLAIVASDLPIPDRDLAAVSLGMLEAAKQDARVIPALDRLYHQASDLDLDARAQSCSRVVAALSCIGGHAAKQELFLLMAEERVRLMREIGVDPAQLELETIRQDHRDLHAERVRRIRTEASWTEEDEQRLVELRQQRMASVLWQSFERALERVESGPGGSE